MKDKIIIEILGSDICTLYGERGNAEYLKARLENYGVSVQMEQDKIGTQPFFAENMPDIILIPPTDEVQQVTLIEKLLPLKQRLFELIEKETVILATGNSREIFGKEILDYKGNSLIGLGLTEQTAKQLFKLRYNENCVGIFENIQIVGYKNQLSHSYNYNKNPLFTMIKGTGDNPGGNGSLENFELCDCHFEMSGSEKNLKPDVLSEPQAKNFSCVTPAGDGITDVGPAEGIRIKNLFATYILGPILPLNPYFTDYLLDIMLGEIKEKKYLPFELEAYADRLGEQ